MFHLFDSPASKQGGSNQKHEERPRWMALLARAPLPLLEQALQPYRSERKTEWLRQPETGLYMIQGRVGGTGARFNLGEITVTRCALRSIGPNARRSPVGVAYVLGRSHRQAELAALADALLQDPDEHDLLERDLLIPIHQHLRRQHAQRQAQVQTTKVDFFTVARESAGTTGELREEEA